MLDHAKPIYSILLFACLAGILTACAQSDSTAEGTITGSELSVPVPRILLNARAIDVSSLSLQFELDGLAIESEVVGNQGDRIVDVFVAEGSTVEINLIWFHGEYEIARLSRTVGPVTSDNEIVIFTSEDYNTDADLDGDGSSNLTEIIQGTDPENAASSPELSTRVARVTTTNGDFSYNLDFQYDELGRPQLILLADPADGNSLLDTSFLYNDIGQLAEKKRFNATGITELLPDEDIGIMTDEASVFTYVYDGPLLQTEQVSVFAADQFLGPPENYTIDFFYNASNQIQSSVILVDDGSAALVVNYEYDDAGRLIRSIPDGIDSLTTTHTYDEFDRRILSEAGVDFRVTYSYESGVCELRTLNDLQRIFDICYR